MGSFNGTGDGDTEVEDRVASLEGGELAGEGVGDREVSGEGDVSESSQSDAGESHRDEPGPEIGDGIDKTSCEGNKGSQTGAGGDDATVAPKIEDAVEEGG